MMLQTVPHSHSQLTNFLNCNMVICIYVYVLVSERENLGKYRHGVFLTNAITAP